MSDRPQQGNRGNRGGGRGGSRGRGGGGGGGSAGNRPAEKPKKENILDLAKYTDKRVIVQFQGGRQVMGILKGFDPLSNLVLDEAEEYLRDPEDHTRLTDEKRKLGLVVTRSTAMILISPYDGTEETEDPFSQIEAAAE
ncbi:U6 snRNP-associated protein Lsm7 [Polyrhizophydium stewartii]|uniref:U6 snRNP-associated protein Lsm7 n=1 Tax=Polyrhizophydium stewartii TaxID=2732419 RepID=A0ABR4MWF6_9FUNG|nr:Sm-like protein lsm7 [Polyrhizophydium stewartii]